MQLIQSAMSISNFEIFKSPLVALLEPQTPFITTWIILFHLKISNVLLTWYFHTAWDIDIQFCGLTAIVYLLNKNVWLIVA